MFSRSVSLAVALLLILGGRVSAYAVPSTAAAPAVLQPATAVVRAVLFWAEGCPKCHQVMREVLPPLQARYGGQLAIHQIEISAQADYDVFRGIEDYYHVPAERRGVPALFIADWLLAGSDQIPARLPGLIEQYLAAGGADFPRLPGLERYLPGLAEGQPLAQLRLVGGVAPAAEPVNNGFALAIAIMALMALALVYALVATVRNQDAGAGTWPAWADTLVPVLAVLGLGVAGYLTFVETQNIAPICGPVGDCGTVQSSPFARLFGFLPIGLLGLLGYIGILVAWAVARRAAGRLAELARVAAFGMAVFGVLFSLYLTYLEPFVIRAVCAWCLTSAVLITLIMVLTLRPALAVLAADDGEDYEDEA